MKSTFSFFTDLAQEEHKAKATEAGYTEMAVFSTTKSMTFLTPATQVPTTAPISYTDCLLQKVRMYTRGVERVLFQRTIS